MAPLLDLVRVADAVAAERGRKAKIGRMAVYLRGLPLAEAPLAACLLAGELPRGRIGVGPAQVHGCTAVAPATAASLTLGALDAALADLAAVSGPGSTQQRRTALHALFARATLAEHSFLARLLLGELRQGATQGLLLEAIAVAAGVPAQAVQRGAMLSGDIMGVAETALREGSAGLAGVGLTLFRPIQPMLAQAADDLDQALADLPDPFLEYKLDGARIQVHKRGAEVAVFSRQGNPVTAAVPEIVAQIAALPDPDLVLDGEVLALRPDGRPHPFQTTMRRFGRRLDVDTLRAELPLTPVYFDCIQRAGELLIDAPAEQRFAAMADALPAASLIPRLRPDSPEAARAFLDAALGAGHEGLMAKAADSPYAAGNRGAAWLKIKPTHTLDLVVLAAEWGSGRRRGWLSNLHLGAREGERLVMLGKTFKGLTDAMLAWQTEQLLALEQQRDAQVVWVRPALVVEIAFNELQESRQYPGGLALRFARVKRHRPDKSADQASTMAEVRALFARQVAYQAS